MKIWLSPAIFFALFACAAKPVENSSHPTFEANDIIECMGAYDVPPELISGRPPSYPNYPIYGEKFGFVAIAFEITNSGTTEKFEKLYANQLAFYNETKWSVKKWVFKPPTNQGIPTSASCIFKWRFGYQWD